VNAAAEDASSAETPSAAATVCTTVPVWMPRTEAIPAARPWSIDRVVT
jgi:hypothetical protein